MKKLSEKKKAWIERSVYNNRAYKSFLYNRFFIYLLSALAQVAALAAFTILLLSHSKWALVLQLVIELFALGLVCYIVSHHDRASTKLSWIILILVFPVFGSPTYLACSGGRPTKGMQKKIQRAQEENESALKEAGFEIDSLSLPDGFLKEPQPIQADGLNRLDEADSLDEADGVSRYLQTQARYPAFTGGKICYYQSGEEVFPDMLKAIESAKKYILLEYFIISAGEMWNAVLQRLIEKAEAGVQVRIIYDDVGCIVTLPPKYDEYLESFSPNMQCLKFNKAVPFFDVKLNHRDHRKMLVVDGRVAFTGGINLADEYINKKERFGYWKDTSVKIEGSAAWAFTKIFFALWNAFYKQKSSILEFLPVKAEKQEASSCVSGEGILQPFDDSPLDRKSVAETVYAQMIHSAKRYVYIFTPYLVLDDYLRQALIDAAERGVDVRIVTPGIPDKKAVYRLTRSNYGVLQKSGVKIYEYTPGFIHAKSIVCDDCRAVVGTINFDYRSLYHHFENAVYFTQKEAVLAVKRDAEQVFSVSKQKTPENTKSTFFSRAIDCFLRVFETLL